MCNEECKICFRKTNRNENFNANLFYKDFYENLGKPTDAQKAQMCSCVLATLSWCKTRRLTSTFMAFLQTSKAYIFFIFRLSNR